MTAATPPPPRDGEVPWCNLSSCPEWVHGGHRITTGRCIVSPAAPSEPPAADSPTPGTETCTCYHESNCSICARRDPSAHRVWCPAYRPAAPSPVDTTEPPAETQQDGCPDCGDQRKPNEYGRCQICGRSGDRSQPAQPASASEPPVEAQQDDEVFGWLRDGTSVAVRADQAGGVRILVNNDGEGASADLTAADVAELAAALAARPSADTEKLRYLLARWAYERSPWFPALPWDDAEHLHAVFLRSADRFLTHPDVRAALDAR